jgi:hypothetical protein
MTYALALLGRTSAGEPLVGLLAEECRSRKMRDFKAQELTNTTWALAKMGHNDQMYYEAVCNAVGETGSMVGSRPQTWSNLVYALALVRHLCPAVMHAMSTAMLGDGLAQHAKAQECANLLWACSALGWHSSRDLVGVLLKRLCEQLDEAASQALTNSLWSLAALGQVHQHQAAAEQLLVWAHDLDISCLSIEDLAQLWQVHVEAQYRCLGPTLQLHGPLLAAAEAATRQQMLENRSHTASNMQAEAVQALFRLHEEPPAGSRLAIIASPMAEYVLEASPGTAVKGHPDKWLLLVDCVVEVAWTSPEDGVEHRALVAVEVDGKMHFNANNPHTRSYDGRSQLRNRWLAHAFGGRFVLLPYWRLNGVPTPTLISYLVRELEAAVRGQAGEGCMGCAWPLA